MRVLLFALLLGRSGWKRWYCLRFFAFVVAAGVGRTAGMATLFWSGLVWFCFCFCFFFFFFFLGLASVLEDSCSGGW